MNETEKGVAAAFSESHQGQILYCWPWRKWLIWAGKRWEEDETGRIYRIFFKFIDKLRSTNAKFADSLENERKMTPILRITRSMPGIPILPEQLNTAPYLLNCSNCTINLKTGDCHEHRPSDYITALAPAAYNPEVQPGEWLRFLGKITGGDQDLQGYLQRAVGYSLTGDVGEHVLFFLYGTGANGKSTFLNTILNTLGPEYAKPAPKDLLMMKYGGEHPTATSVLYGARFIATIEPDGNRKLAEGLTKQLTGGDKVQTRRMREDFWFFTPTHKIWLAANHKPNIIGQDPGIWRRIRLVPFTVQIPDSEIELNYEKRFENEIDAIFSWAVQGELSWQKLGKLEEPVAVTRATSAYQEEMDALGDFLNNDPIIHDRLKNTSVTNLYSAYKTWCEENNERKLTKKKLSIVLKERGYEQIRTSSARAWKGISIAGDDELFN